MKRYKTADGWIEINLDNGDIECACGDLAHKIMFQVFRLKRTYNKDDITLDEYLDHLKGMLEEDE